MLAVPLLPPLAAASTLAFLLIMARSWRVLCQYLVVPTQYKTYVTPAAASSCSHPKRGIIGSSGGGNGAAVMVFELVLTQNMRILSGLSGLQHCFASPPCHCSHGSAAIGRSLASIRQNRTLQS